MLVFMQRHGGAVTGVLSGFDRLRFRGTKRLLANASAIEFQERDNCFVWLADPSAAQAWMGRQLETDWPKLLDQLALRVHPQEPTIFADATVPYYCSMEQSEWATDLMFRSGEALGSIRG